jgi:hypothetical protein
MSGAFRYKPRFVDIRVRPPKPGQEDASDPLPDVQLCEHVGCRQPATAQAPKSREHSHERYAFCGAHAAEYNRKWDYFEGMSECEIRAHQAASATGDRPTWAFKASARSREAAAFAAKLGSAAGVRDAFGMFGGPNARLRPEPAPGRHLGKLERGAFADLDLAETADGPAIRTRYTELVKRFHPDVNGGDRSAEEKLQRVIKAYKTLRAAKLA